MSQIKYTVKWFDAHHNAHRVVDGEGVSRLVDLMVNGDFPEDTHPDDLVGKTFVADYDYPFIAIAMNVNPNPIQ